ncbi:hypothetical protein [Xanthovirga aplysinae]|uniref:hypothetical protein n=1 Tax=Xanthovirga aplysinae TaxID=2529853 RepID=UPI0012BD3B7C|nr:hypothetical protein [Xanthovirga aplysinae]MTI30877.1 hypothetical protein [Xanthovirga aplysinae]
MNTKVYKLTHDYNHSGDPERDAFHFPFEHANKASIMFINPKYRERLPDKIYFQANFSLIPEYDYPLTDLRIPVMSLKMLSVLKSLGEFEHLEVPVEMIDDAYPVEDVESLQEEVPVIKTYIALMLMSRENVFDYKTSIFEPSSFDPSKPGIIEKLVLHKPKNGFAPIFRIDEAPDILFVSQTAKESLEVNGIKGCVFKPVEVSE